jgi:hypothetical protein
MNLKSFFQLDPDFFNGSFEPILIEAETEDRKSTIVLGFIEEHGALYFVLRKRYPAWIMDISLDRIRLSEAVRKIRDKGLVPSSGSSEETLKVAFENFVKESLFGSYVRENINAWASGQFFKQLRAIAPAIITPQSRRQDEQGSSDITLQSTGNSSG